MPADGIRYPVVARWWLGTSDPRQRIRACLYGPYLTQHLLTANAGQSGKRPKRSAPMTAWGQRRRSSPRPQCPQLPPIADIRLIPNDPPLVPQADVSRCSKRRGYSITSSARASSVSGTVRPSALAVFMLITRSYLVGAWTGRSAGFVPLRMRSTYAAARGKSLIESGP